MSNRTESPTVNTQAFVTTTMRPNIDISHALAGRVKDYAEANDLTTTEAYVELLAAGLDQLDER